MASTTGTVSQHPYSNRKILDRAFGRAGYVPQKISGEGIAISLDLLYTMLQEWVAAGFPLWTKRYNLLGIRTGSPQVPTPAGTNDIFHAYWRILQPYRGPAILPGGGTDMLLFGGQPSSDVVVAGANPSVTVNFTSQTEVNTIGVLLGSVAAITAALNVQTSTDGITFTTVQTLPSATYAPLAWTYFDLDPSITTQYLRLQYVTGGSWTLNQLNFGLANGQDIELGPLSLDDYYNLPNKKFQSNQPNSVYIDRQNPVPILQIWPTPSLNAFYNGTVTTVLRQYIQDPGSMTQIVDAPVRWLEAIQWRLAHKIITGIPEEQLLGQPGEALTPLKMQARQARIELCDKEATKAEAIIWGEERTRGPISLYPILSCYTK